MKKIEIAVIGSGGREHALSWKLSQSDLAGTVYTIPGNPGIPNSVAIPPSDFAYLKQWAIDHAIDLIIVGPETPLADGIVDYFKDSGIAIFGPGKTAAQLESSKAWAKQFMRKHGVATARAVTLSYPFTKQDILETVSTFHGKVVLKFDGLAAGKGVFVCSSPQETESLIDLYWANFGGKGSLILEELLSGFEISIIGITDGKTIRLFPASQDHKRLLDGDLGPNTGGMGAYTPVKACTPDLLEKIQNTIITPTLNGLQADGLDYKGFLYFGVLVQNDIPYLLEYNVRLGDPEAQVLLPALSSDLLEAVLATLNGSLQDHTFTLSDQHFVTVALVSGGYPGSIQKGFVIEGLDAAAESALLFMSGVGENGKKELINNGGRVVNIVASAGDFSSALHAVYAACEKVHFEKMFYRRDIGRKNL